jgi:hypothetical protein
MIPPPLPKGGIGGDFEIINYKTSLSPFRGWGQKQQNTNGNFKFC